MKPFPKFLCLLIFFAPAMEAPALSSVSSNLKPAVIVSTDEEPIAQGPFQPSWQSLSQYQVPQWFKDAKFGIWAHWGPQCQPEEGDWYARAMYQEGSEQYKSHLERYGHPSKSGFKDIIHEWKAENWNPQELVSLYKRAGAQYFFALANHHDNFDLWDSKYHAWNSVHIGPQKDIIAQWAQAARSSGLRFGVSVHASHAWSWYEPAQGADKTGPLAGVHYDGTLTKAQGAGQWWEGLDPQELYAQHHALSSTDDMGKIWEWQNGCSQPDQAYCQAYYNRTIDLINHVNPDLVYFDDTALPLWPVSDAGLKIAAHLYNSNMRNHGGNLQAVLFGKILEPDQRKCIVWDIERGQSDRIEPIPWQTDTCIGNWHYDRKIYNQDHYKSAATVIHTLADVVSKNGNLLLSIPVRGDGTIDEKERKVVEGIADWMDQNREAIFSTHPWKVCGEGPKLQAAPPLHGAGFNEGHGAPFTNRDVRYTAKENVVYALVLGKPQGTVKLEKLAKSPGAKVEKVEQLGTGTVKWEQAEDALNIAAADTTGPADQTVVFRIRMGTAQ